MHRLSELELPSYISQHFTPTLTQIAVKPLLKVCLVLTFTAHPHHAVEKGMWGAMEQEEEEIKMDFNLSLPKAASVKKSENKLSCHLPKSLLPDEQKGPQSGNQGSLYSVCPPSKDSKLALERRSKLSKCTPRANP